MKRALSSIAIGLLLLVAFLCANAMLQPSRQVAVEHRADFGVDAERVARHLAGAIPFATISHQDSGRTDAAAFRALHDYLEATYPLVHDRLSRETVADLSLLYTWEATGGSESKPILLMAHLDVVPVAPGTEADWLYPPFEGHIEDGYVWGRGAMDDKASVVGILEAVELLLAAGFEPNRTTYLAFGHDEEVGGDAGAAATAALLAERGVRLSYVLDEGLAISDGIFPGLDERLAMIGVAEKGYLSLRLSVAGRGGHSSMPPLETPVGILAAALDRLEKAQMTARIDGPVRELLETVAPEMPMTTRVALSNLWLSGPLVLRGLTGSAASRAMTRTTTAPTMLAASVKENVLPTSATAVVNFRIHPRDSVDAVIQHVGYVVGDDRVEVEPLGTAREPSATSDTDSASYRAIAAAVRESFAGALVAPGLVVGGTDSRHYSALAENTYRFLPLVLQPEDPARLHGTNERHSVADLGPAVTFYARLLSRSAGGQE